LVRDGSRQNQDEPENPRPVARVCRCCARVSSFLHLFVPKHEWHLENVARATLRAANSSLAKS